MESMAMLMRSKNHRTLARFARKIVGKGKAGIRDEEHQFHCIGKLRGRKVDIELDTVQGKLAEIVVQSKGAHYHADFTNEKAFFRYNGKLNIRWAFLDMLDMIESIKRA